VSGATRDGKRVAVIGGGYAGLAAAVTLAEHGVAATVFESARELGGRARRVLTRGHALDNGQHILVGAYAQLLRLMRLTGVPADAVLRLPLELRYAHAFSLRALWWPAPFGLLAGLIGARGVALGERWGAVRFMQALRARGFRIAPDCSVEALLERHRQNGRIGHFLWRPLCVAALNTPPQQASAQVFAAVLRDALAGADGASDLLLPRVDLSRLFPERAADYLRANGGEIRAGCTVRGVSPGLEIEGEAFSGVIIAVGPHQLRPFAPLVGALPQFAYQPIYTCYLQYAERVKLPFPMLGIDSGLVQWAFDRGALLGEKGQMACVISAQGDHQQMTHGEVAAACHAALSAALGRLPDPLWSRVIAEKRATIACTPGLGRPAPLTATRRCFLAGDYTDPEYPPTLEAAARSGVRAAQLAVEAA
jgi:squalene-associated FAD-dependent desaturase